MQIKLSFEWMENTPRINLKSPSHFLDFELLPVSPVLLTRQQIPGGRDRDGTNHDKRNYQQTTILPAIARSLTFVQFFSRTHLMT